MTYYSVPPLSRIISLSYSNGDGKFKSSTVASYFNQDGVLTNSNYQRFSARANTEYVFSKIVKVGVNLAPSFSINNSPQSDGNWTEDKGSILQGAMLTTPLAPYKNEDGSIPLVASGPGLFDNPNWYNVVRLNKNKASSPSDRERLLGGRAGQRLKVKTSINADLTQNKWNSFKPSTSGEIYKAPYQIPEAKESNNLFYTWLWENTATYSKQIKDHSFDLLFGISAQKYHSEYTMVTGTNFPDDKISTFNAAPTITADGNINEWSLLSYIGRINYNYKGKYLLSAAMRRDGSSRFGKNNRWGNFPSVSAGWILSDEEFMKPLEKTISFLKARISYGIVGNDQIGNYTRIWRQSLPRTATSITPWPAAEASREWETRIWAGKGISKSMSVRMSVSSIISLSIMYDYYSKRTDALLFSLSTDLFRLLQYQSNAGKLKFWDMVLYPQEP